MLILLNILSMNFVCMYIVFLFPSFFVFESEVTTEVY